MNAAIRHARMRRPHTHSVSVISSAVDQGALTPLDAVARLNALSQDVAFTSLPPAHSARADVMAAVSKLAAESCAGAGAAFRAVAARELAGVYRVQVGGGLHIKFCAASYRYFDTGPG
jgi:hypothetical protein